jgi:signal peptidase II
VLLLRRIFLPGLFVLAVITDQITKILVDSYFNLYDLRPLIGDVLRLHYIRNSGAAFGLRIGDPAIMLIVNIVVISLLVYLYFSGKIDPGGLPGRSAIVLVLGGAVGNLIDRLRLGEVIDFIDMGIGSYRWPTYNFADIYVTVGMFVLFFYIMFQSGGGDIETGDAA